MITYIEKLNQIKLIRKKNGNIVPFDTLKLLNTIKSKINEDILFEKIASNISINIINLIQEKINESEFIISTNMIQEIIDETLNLQKIKPAIKCNISDEELNQSSQIKTESKQLIANKVQKLAQENKKYFKSSLGEFVYYRTYSRWIEEERRRETWTETVDRYISFMKENLSDKLSENEYFEIKQAILNQEVMPSMRLLQFAGTAARRTNVCAYNCSFIAPENFRDLSEIMFILMCGTGIGFSVESKNIQKFPQIKKQTGEKLPTYIIDDSKEGWCQALLLGLESWTDGKDIDFDYSKLRPAGARLKTMGGKSSGPEPLRQLLNFTREKIITRQSEKLTTLDVHDIICKIGEIVVSGGVRRSALISLSDLHDSDLRDSKKGHFYLTNPERCLANNSAVYLKKPNQTEFLEEWLALMKSGSGERGIFNRGGLEKTLPQKRLDISQDYLESFGTNPCGEIILRSKQFCNLSEVIARQEDTEETLLKKIRIATILGTYQATLTHFTYLSDEWKKNCQEERLLGVSITGQWDCLQVRNAETLKKLRLEAEKINKVYSEKFGINESTCITCVKPSGTVSKSFDTASGMHPRHSKYYIQRIRISNTDFLFKMLKDQGIPYHPEVGQSKETATTYVFEFPVKSPDGAVVKDDLTAIEQLEHWKIVKENYTEHNPSVTVSVGENEWLEVANWLYKNWDIIGGLSFLPRSNHVYQLAPYEAIDEKSYYDLLKKVEHIDFSKILNYESEDETEIKTEFACVSGSCELI